VLAPSIWVMQKFASVYISAIYKISFLKVAKSGGAFFLESFFCFSTFSFWIFYAQFDSTIGFGKLKHNVFTEFENCCESSSAGPIEMLP